MKLKREKGIAVLTMLSPEDRGLPMIEDWKDHVRELHVRALPAKQAVEAFGDGKVDVVLNGRIEGLPLVDTGPLSRGTVRVDSGVGLFGLSVRRAEGFLADPAGREAIAMALDREALLAPFNLGGWNPTTRVVAPGLPGDPGTIAERWANLSLAQRRSAAAARVASWQAAHGGQAPALSAALPDGPGSDLLFAGLAKDLQAIGITLTRAKGNDADLELVDRVARYASARWFLNQFHCGLKPGLCSKDADDRSAEAVVAADPVARAMLLAEAEAELTALNAYIPIAEPVRWSLVRAGIDGFAANQWVIHPLPPLATLPR
jgi:ABC-type oligopeptide transport system substrate-binding subunit